MDGRQWLRVGVIVKKKLEKDRFNDLSDEVVHHILSFLSIRDLACFGSASKRCKELCLSTPSLNFDELCHRDLSTSSKRLMLLSSLDRFLVRRGDEKLQQFHLVWDIDHFLVKEFSYEEEKCRVITWIHNAVKCNVEVLDLECGSFRMTPTPFPSCVFLCRSLRSLMVDMKLMVFKEPSSASFSNLECLKLRNVKIADEGFFKWFSCYCNCIKELCLEQVSGVQNITIESSSLLSFSFVNHSLTEQCQLSIAAEKLADLVIDIKSIPHRKSINILAPNLTNMKWIGRMLIHQNLGEFIRLEKADLFFLKNGAYDFGIVSEFLCSICRVEVLILNAESLKVFACTKEGSMPRPLDNVRYLRIDIGSLLDDLVLAMICLFKTMPNLSTLHVNTDRIFLHSKTESSGFDVERWKLENPTFVSELEEVTIELPGGSNGIELSRYILEHAQNLRKMVIVHSPQQSHVRRTLKKSKKISNATIVFQKDLTRGS